MIRVQLDLSVPHANVPFVAQAIADAVGSAMVDEALPQGTLVHRLTVEEADQ